MARTLDVTPTPLDFGPIRVGAESGLALELRNTGDTVLELPAFSVQESAAESGFALPSALPGRLQPGESTTVWVTCRPSRRGEHAATIVIETLTRPKRRRELRGRVEVPATATGAAPVVFLPARFFAPLTGELRRPAGPIDLPPRPGPDLLDLQELELIDFGPVDMGRSLQREFRIRSTGELPLRVSDVETSPADTFDIPDRSVFPRDLAPGDEMTVAVQVTAPFLWDRALVGAVTVVTDDPWRPRATFAVRARTTGPHLVAHEGLDFGTGASPLTASHTFTSAGTRPVIVTNILILDDPPFALVGRPTLPLTLDPGDTMTLTLRCTASPGPQRGQLVVEWREGANYIHLAAEITP